MFCINCFCSLEWRTCNTDRLTCLPEPRGLTFRAGPLFFLIPFNRWSSPIWNVDWINSPIRWCISSFIRLHGSCSPHLMNSTTTLDRHLFLFFSNRSARDQFLLVSFQRVCYFYFFFVVELNDRKLWVCSLFRSICMTLHPHVCLRLFNVFLFLLGHSMRIYWGRRKF